MIPHNIFISIFDLQDPNYVKILLKHIPSNTKKAAAMVISVTFQNDIESSDITEIVATSRANWESENNIDRQPWSVRHFVYHGRIAHYNDVVMGAIACQITSLTSVYSTVYSGVDQWKHRSSASLACVRGIHRRSVNSPHKLPVTRKMFPFDDVIMQRDKKSQTAWLLKCANRRSCPNSASPCRQQILHGL